MVSTSCLWWSVYWTVQYTGRHGPERTTEFSGRDGRSLSHFAIADEASFRTVHCPNSILNLCIKTEPITEGIRVYATLYSYVWFMVQICIWDQKPDICIPLHTLQPCSRLRICVNTRIIFGTVCCSTVPVPHMWLLVAGGSPCGDPMLCLYT